MADNGKNRRIGDDTFGIGNTGIRVCLIVKRCKFDLKAHGFQRPAQLLEGHLGTTFDVNTRSRRSPHPP